MNTVGEITLAYRPNVKLSQLPNVICFIKVYGAMLRFWNQYSLEYFGQFQVIVLSMGNRVLELQRSVFEGLRGICRYQCGLCRSIESQCFIDCPQSQSYFQKFSAFIAEYKYNQTVGEDWKGIGPTGFGLCHPLIIEPHFFYPLILQK